jgi:hypothetical protein
MLDLDMLLLVATKHDGPTGTNLGAHAFAYKVFMDAKSFRKAFS